jgi:cation transport protein ChaC
VRTLAVTDFDADAARRTRAAFVAPKGELWVFAYGSLMWDPCFAHDRSRSALVRGYHRAFCVYSVRHRGTYEQPGLVLGLNRGGSCRGLAFRVPAKKVEAALDALWVREMSREAYVPRLLRVDLGGVTAQALTFVADTGHAHYAGDLTHEDTAQVIARGSGQRGPNLDYLHNTLQHLAELGVRDLGLSKLHQRTLELREDCSD